MLIKDIDNKKIENPKIIWEILTNILKLEDEADKDKEHCWIIGLKTNNVVKYIDLVSLGNLNASIVHPREIFRTAIFQGVNSIIMAHNHPSGTTAPSVADHNITNQIKEAGDILGIKLLDSLIITEKAFNTLI